MIVTFHHPYPAYFQIIARAGPSFTTREGDLIAHGEVNTFGKQAITIPGLVVEQPVEIRTRTSSMDVHSERKYLARITHEGWIIYESQDETPKDA